MLIDSTLLMYSVFQSCRHGLHKSGERLDLLIETLEIVKQQSRLLIGVSGGWVRQHQVQKLAVALWARLQRKDALSPTNQKLFSLVDVGARELRVLWSTESIDAVRCLGYAFHIIPALLWKPEQFSPEEYMFCFQRVCMYWGELSLEMRHVFCEVVGSTLDEAATIANQRNIE